ncbi:MAG: ABC transporter permease subunit [Pseudomonadota bacterium]
MSDDYASPWEIRLNWAYMLAIVGALMTPVFYNLYISFNEFGFGAARYAFTLDWYAAVFQDAQLLTALRWTGLLAVATALIAVPFGLLAAKLYKRLDQKLWLLALMLLPLFTPADIFASSLLVFFKTLNGAFTGLAELTGLAWFETWFELGFLTALIGLVIYVCPYVFVVILITMGRYNPEHTEAARACGATGWQAFWQVEFPQIRPGVMSATAFTVILVFNEYVRSNALKGGFDTLTTLLISQMLNTGMSEQSYAMGGLISIVAIVGVGGLIIWTLIRAERLARRQRGVAEPAGS